MKIKLDTRRLRGTDTERKHEFRDVVVGLTIVCREDFFKKVPKLDSEVLQDFVFKGLQKNRP